MRLLPILILALAAGAHAQDGMGCAPVMSEPAPVPTVTDQSPFDELVRILNDSRLAWTVRYDAEKRLCEFHDLPSLERFFDSLATPVEFSMGKAVPGWSTCPGTGSAENDAKFLPVEAQIAYARFRVLDAMCKPLYSSEEYADLAFRLLDRVTCPPQQQFLRQALPPVDRGLMARFEAVLASPEKSDTAKVIVAHHMLNRGVGAVSRDVFRAAWSARGASLGRDLTRELSQSETLAGSKPDARLAVLLADLYLNARDLGLRCNRFVSLLVKNAEAPTRLMPANDNPAEAISNAQHETLLAWIRENHVRLQRSAEALGEVGP